MNTRRNILKVLGMTAITGTVATDALGETVGDNAPSLARSSERMQDRIATSLESLAKAIRAGEVAAIGIDVHSSLRADEWLEHEVKVRVEILQDQAAV